MASGGFASVGVARLFKAVNFLVSEALPDVSFVWAAVTLNLLTRADFHTAEAAQRTTAIAHPLPVRMRTKYPELVRS